MPSTSQSGFVFQINKSYSSGHCENQGCTNEINYRIYIGHGDTDGMHIHLCQYHCSLQSGILTGSIIKEHNRTFNHLPVEEQEFNKHDVNIREAI